MYDMEGAHFFGRRSFEQISIISLIKVVSDTPMRPFF